MDSTSAQRWFLLCASFFGPWFVFPSACMRKISYSYVECRGLLPGLSPKFSSLLLAHITVSSTGVLVCACPYSVVLVFSNSYPRIERTHRTTFVGRRIRWRLTFRHCHDHRRNARSSRKNCESRASLVLYMRNFTIDTVPRQ